MIKVADGRHEGTKAATMGELLDQWVEWRAGNGKDISPRILNDYRQLIATRIKSALGSMAVGTVDVRTPWRGCISSGGCGSAGNGGPTSTRGLPQARRLPHLLAVPAPLIRLGALGGRSHGSYTTPLRYFVCFTRAQRISKAATTTAQCTVAISLMVLFLAVILVFVGGLAAAALAAAG
jgi:hypothetical protein